MPSQPDHRVTIRLKPSEYAILQKKAGGKPLSTYSRGLLLDQAAAVRTKSKPAPVKDHAALAQVLALLGSSSLMKQFRYAERAIQDGVSIQERDEQLALQQIARDIAEIKAYLMQALGVSEQ